MDYFPIFYNLNNKPCLIVGGGEIASRKTELLLRSGADITVVALKACEYINTLQENNRITLYCKPFAESDISKQTLIVAATNDMVLNRQISSLAKAHNIPVNVVDTPELCSFIFPAIIDRNPIIAAVSSAGKSPVLARLLRAKLESLIPSGYGQLAKIAEKYRSTVKKSLGSINERRRFWESVLQGPIAEKVFSGQIEQAERQLQQSLTEHINNPKRVGEVYLVGAGPGDPDLLTFRALRLMQQADVVVYDRLVSPQVLDLARRDADKIYVGKQRNNHALPQDSINELLADLAKNGKRVVRLKGGDPFIFGRGGEEIETLMQQNIDFQVVPGITAAAGCASYAGIPLTHREHAQACLFVTGHLKDGSIDLNWEQLSKPKQTVVIYMGLVGLQHICEQLIAHGCDPEHPVAVIQQGTTIHHKVLTGTLRNMPELVKQHEIIPPTLIIIGTVVKLQEKLGWYKNPNEVAG